MRKKRLNRNFIYLFVALCLTIFLFSYKPWVIVSKKNTTEKGIENQYGNNSFNPTKIVEDMWDVKLIPYMNEKAKDINDVKKALASNNNKDKTDFSVRQSEDETETYYIVRGIGKVLSLNTESRNGKMEIDLPPFDNKADLIIQIGPVIKRNVIRDSCDFIKFEDYPNQVDFSQLGTEINNKVYKTLFEGKDVKSYLNKDINFVGAFVYDGSENILITPVNIEVKGGA